MSASLLVYCVGVVTRTGLYPIAKETAEAAPTLCTEFGPNGWMDGLASKLSRLGLNLIPAKKTGILVFHGQGEALVCVLSPEWTLNWVSCLQTLFVRH